MKRIAFDGLAFGVVSKEILGAEVSEDFVKSLAELVVCSRLENAAAAALGDQLEGILTASVAARIVGDGRHKDGIDSGLGALDGDVGTVEFFVRCSVATVCNADDDLAAFTAFELFAGQIEGVIEGSAGTGLDVADGVLKTLDTASEAGDDVDVVVEGNEGESVVGVAFFEQRAGEAEGRFSFVLEVFGDTCADVEHNDDVEGLGGRPLKDRDLLLDAIVKDLEIFFVEAAEELAVLVSYASEDADQFDVYAKDWVLGLQEQRRC